MATNLRGHKQTVLSVCVTSDASGRVVSGAEEGELYVWSQDGTPIHHQDLSCGDDITSLCCSKRRPDNLYVGTSSQVLTYDLRQMTEPIASFSFNEDEINQIVLNEKEDYLAACDDSGQIKVINLSEKRVYKTLRKHTNICATVVFHPRRSWDIFSGGYDSKLIQWDFSRGRSVCVIEMEDIGNSKPNEGAYLVNPPFVHSLAMCKSGQYLACGTENAQVQVFRASRRNPEYLCSLHGHSQGVSQVHFPEFVANHLVSAGNDGQILLWNLQNWDSRNPTVNGHGHMNGGAPHADIAGNGQGNNGAGHHGNGVDQGDHAGDHGDQPYRTINHGSKVNWLASGRTANRQFLAVADNTETLTIYPYPQ